MLVVPAFSFASRAAIVASCCGLAPSTAPPFGNAWHRDALIRTDGARGVGSHRRRLMDTNSGEPWSEMDVWELKHSMEYGRSFAEVAGFLYRDESEVRQMADALGLKEGGGMRGSPASGVRHRGIRGKKNRLTPSRRTSERDSRPWDVGALSAMTDRSALLRRMGVRDTRRAFCIRRSSARQNPHRRRPFQPWRETALTRLTISLNCVR